MLSEQTSFPNVVIRASAGTGKTFQLANRYLSLVNAGVAPERILAVTFTRKAAGEILERILLRLAEATTSAAKLDDLQQHIAGPQLDRRRCLTLLKTLLHHPHRIHVSTLDSFFAQVATVLALELHLPVGWQIVDEIDDQRLRAEALQALLSAASIAELLTLLRVLSKGDATRSVQQQLSAIATDLYGMSRQSQAQAWHALPLLAPLTEPELTEALDRVKALEWTDTRFANACKTNLKAFEQEHWEDFVTKGLAKPLLNGEGTYYRKPIASAVYDAYTPLLHHARAMFLRLIAAQNDATKHLVDRFDQAYTRLKHRHHALRFDDVTQALASTLTGADLDHIGYRLDAPITHLLVDEFQDTSLQQWTAIRPFADQMARQEGQSFFCVGDVKQAIYGWRGGVSELMDAVVEELPTVSEARLNVSYRSSQIVIDTVNAVFQHLAASPVLQPYPDVLASWQQRFAPHTTQRHELSGYSRLVQAPAAADGEKQSTATLRWAAAEVARLYHDNPDHTLGVLVRRNQTVKELIYALRHTHDIPASEEGGNPLTDAVEVECMLSVFRLADHPGDTVARYHVAQSPLGPLVGLTHYDDDALATRVSHEVRQRLMTQGYGCTIYTWVRDLAAWCDRRALNRLVQLVDLAYGYDARATERPLDFVEYIRTKKVEDPTAATVRVMTIHQAKGLEFDTVVLPELDVEITGLTPLVVVERTSPTQPIEALCRYVKQGERTLLPERFQQMFTAQRSQEVNEALCVLYVAMTRAIHALHMIVAPSPPTAKRLPQTCAALLRTTLCNDEPGAPETVLYTHGAPAWSRHSPSRAEREKRPESEPPTAPPIRLRAPAGHRQRGLERVRPSQVERTGAVHLHERLQSGDTHAMLRGSLYHAWLEQIEWLDDGAPDDHTLRRVAQQFTSPTLDVAREITAFRRLLAMPRVRRALSRQAYADLAHVGFSQACLAEVARHDVVLRVLRERPFAIREHDAVVHGIIDRLVLLCHGDQVLAADILDYKSDTLMVTDAQEKQAVVARYQPQLALYRRAMAQQCGLDLECIATRLVFLRWGELLPVPDNAS
jgi:ATP-dependent exoDNAse (exonuclease V) beta subunit